MLTDEQKNNITKAVTAFRDALMEESGSRTVLVTWSIAEDKGFDEDPVYIGGFSHGEVSYNDIAVMLLQMSHDLAEEHYDDTIE